MNRRIGPISRAVSPGYSWCLRCKTTWNFVEGHVTQHGTGGCFPLCEKCWGELTPTERLPFYEELLVMWNSDGTPATTEKAAALRAAVLAGK